MAELYVPYITLVICRHLYYMIVLHIIVVEAGGTVYHLVLLYTVVVGCSYTVYLSGCD